MKSVTSLFFLLLPFALHAQKPDYNTKIGTIGTLKNRNGVISITKADTIIVQIYTNIPVNSKTKVWATDYWQYPTTDSNNSVFFTTCIILRNPDVNDYLDLKFSAKFDKPIIDVVLEGNGVSRLFNAIGTISASKRDFEFEARRVNTADGLLLRIQSKEQIKVKLYGVEGVL